MIQLEMRVIIIVTIGFMHYRKKPTNKAYAFAVVAKAEEAELLYFSPGAVDLIKNKINGYIYRNGEWINTTSEFPDVICNVVGFSNKKQSEIVESLSEKIPFTSYAIGSKMTVYDNLMKYKEFSSYLIPSDHVGSLDDFFNQLDKYREIVFKPSFGCQGNNVFYIKKVKEMYEISLGNVKTLNNYIELVDFISEKISDNDYLVQPYINCKTKSGNSYDFRLHVQKNSKGEWIATQIYPRVAERGSIICNISKGGYTNDLSAFLKREFGDEDTKIKKYIEVFSLQIAAHMDKIQKELYNEELDELGIDIGLDKNHKICLYEINWRPGYPPSMKINIDVIKNKIQYAIYLAQRSKYLNK